MSDTTPPDSPLKLIDFKELKATKGIAFGRSHLARLEPEGKFPRRVHLGQKRVAWLLIEIDEWLVERQ